MPQVGYKTAERRR